MTGTEIEMTGIGRKRGDSNKRHEREKEAPGCLQHPSTPATVAAR